MAAYLPLEDAWRAQEYSEDRQMPWSWGAYELRYVRPSQELRGRHPLWINGRFLRQAEVRNGELVVGEARFRALHVAATYLDEAVVERLRELAADGLPIVLARTPQPPGHRPPEDYDDRVDALLAEDSVVPDISEVDIGAPLVSGQKLPDFWCRQDGDTRYLFFAHPLAQDLTLPLSYGQSKIEETIEREITVTVDGQRHRVTLHFEPYQSLVLRVTSGGVVEPVDITFTPKTPSTVLPEAAEADHGP